jgi:hypothetical protein
MRSTTNYMIYGELGRYPVEIGKNYLWKTIQNIMHYV